MTDLPPRALALAHVAKGLRRLILVALAKQCSPVLLASQAIQSVRLPLCASPLLRAPLASPFLCPSPRGTSCVAIPLLLLLLIRHVREIGHLHRDAGHSTGHLSAGEGRPCVLLAAAFSKGNR